MNGVAKDALITLFIICAVVILAIWFLTNCSMEIIPPVVGNKNYLIIACKV